MIRPFRCIKTEKNVGSTEKELNTDPAEGTVKVQSVTVTNFSSVTQKLSIGIRSSGVDKDWHPVGEPWTDIEVNSPRSTNLTFYLMKSEMVCAKFEGINLNRNSNGNSTFSNLELNVNGEYIENGEDGNTIYTRGSSGSSGMIGPSTTYWPAAATGAKGQIRH